MSKDMKSIVGKNPIVLGLLLIGIGVIFFLLNVLDIDYGRFAWPFFIILPGIVMLATGLAAGESMGQGWLVIGGIIATSGTILFYQNITNHWTSWAYAWALVAPGSIGLVQLIDGSLRGQNKLVREGRKLLSIGLVIFFCGFVFFELIIGISGFGLGRYGWPVLLIGAGILLLAHGFFFGKKAEPDSKEV